MNRTWSSSAVTMLLSAILIASGCTKGSATSEHAHHEHGHHDHDHAVPGPHGGHLIELGEEAYHAELTHDDPTHKVTIYLLDGAARATPPAGDLPATVSLSFTVAGKSKPVDYTLSKSADGKYDITDEVLCTVLGSEADLDAKFLATIAGKEYSGTLEHHAHEGHHHHPAAK